MGKGEGSGRGKGGKGGPQPHEEAFNRNASKERTLDVKALHRALNDCLRDEYGSDNTVSLEMAAGLMMAWADNGEIGYPEYMGILLVVRGFRRTREDWEFTLTERRTRLADVVVGLDPQEQLPRPSPLPQFFADDPVVVTAETDPSARAMKVWWACPCNFCGGIYTCLPICWPFAILYCVPCCVVAKPDFVKRAAAATKLEIRERRVCARAAAATPAFMSRGGGGGGARGAREMARVAAHDGCARAARARTP